MRILHVCETIIGGTGSYLAEIIPHQAARYGRQNIVLLIPKTQMSYCEKTILRSGIQILTFNRPTRLAGFFAMSRAYLKALREFAPDIVHAHSSLAGGAVRVLGARSASIVYCPHGWSADKLDTKLVQRAAAVAERALARLPHPVVAISQYEYDRGLELGYAPARLKLIRNGISRQQPDVAPAPWDDDRLKILYAGRFDYQKGIDVLLDAVDGLDDRLSVRLVGDFAVDAHLRLRPLPEGVQHVGWLDRDGVVAQMKSADILVVPSRWEGFGLVAIEAMRVGVPVLATSVGGLTEILGNGRYGYLVQPEDSHALRQALERLDRPSLKRMGKAAQQHFLDTYTAERVVRELDELYGGLTGTADAGVSRSEAQVG